MQQPAPAADSVAGGKVAQRAQLSVTVPENQLNMIKTRRDADFELPGHATDASTSYAAGALAPCVGELLAASHSFLTELRAYHPLRDIPCLSCASRWVQEPADSQPGTTPPDTQRRTLTSACAAGDAMISPPAFVPYHAGLRLVSIPGFLSTSEPSPTEHEAPGDMLPPGTPDSAADNAFADLVVTGKAINETAASRGPGTPKFGRLSDIAGAFTPHGDVSNVEAETAAAEEILAEHHGDPDAQPPAIITGGAGPSAGAMAGHRGESMAVAPAGLPAAAAAAAAGAALAHAGPAPVSAARMEASGGEEGLEGEVSRSAAHEASAGAGGRRPGAG